MIYLFIAIFVLLLAFGGVILRGAPYVPTLDPQARAALELLDLKPGQTLLELGSGDGKILVVAARAGLHVVGIELNPFLVAGLCQDWTSVCRPLRNRWQALPLRSPTVL
jgi:DNA modification methylase